MRYVKIYCYKLSRYSLDLIDLAEETCQEAAAFVWNKPRIYEART